MASWRTASAASSERSRSPTLAARATSPSSASTSSTARAAAHATGLPPKVEKKVVLAPKRSTISPRVMTAAMGWPLPIGLPNVTMSGVTPQREKPHSSPVRPWPDCTSSATKSAPASRAAATISATVPGSGTKMPSAVKVESM